MNHATPTAADLYVRAIADDLDDAWRRGVPTQPPSARYPDLDLEGAYEVQQINIRRALARGDTPTGNKVGLTSRAMQQQLGVDQPDFGVLLSSMYVPNGGTAPRSLLQPRIEAEIAFVLGADLDADEIGVDEVLRATESVLPALEIIDSRIADWKITLVDTVADNASSGAYVLGTPVAVPADLREVELVLHRGDDQIASGFGRAALGHPAECVAWLARSLRVRGEVLRAGSVVLSGAVHASVPALPGETFTARSQALGSVSVTFPATIQEESQG